MAGIADVEPRAKELYERLTAVIPEVNDIADEVFSLGGDDVELQMQELTDKVSAIKHAKRKYNMDADELVDYLDECRDELAELSTADDEIELLTEK